MLSGERTTSVQVIQSEIKKAQEKDRAYIKDLNKWIDGINHFAGQMNAKIGSIKKSTQQAIDQRNAQNLVAMHQAGLAAGVTWTGATKEARIQSVVTGGTPVSGAFAGKTFKVPDLTLTAQVSASKFIELTDDGLAYVRPPEPAVAEAEEPLAFPEMPKLPEP